MLEIIKWIVIGLIGIYSVQAILGIIIALIFSKKL